MFQEENLSPQFSSPFAHFISFPSKEEKDAPAARGISNIEIKTQITILHSSEMPFLPNKARPWVQGRLFPADVNPTEVLPCALRPLTIESTNVQTYSSIKIKMITWN